MTNKLLHKYIIYIYSHESICENEVVNVYPYTQMHACTSHNIPTFIVKSTIMEPDKQKWGRKKEKSEEFHCSTNRTLPLFTHKWFFIYIFFSFFLDSSTIKCISRRFKFVKVLERKIIMHFFFFFLFILLSFFSEFVFQIRLRTPNWQADYGNHSRCIAFWWFKRERICKRKQKCWKITLCFMEGKVKLKNFLNSVFKFLNTW